MPLSYLEKLEARLLSWGVVDGAFSREEILQHLQGHLDSTPDDTRTAESLLDDFLDRCLLFRFVDQQQGSRYRTRMAETVRLLVRLRQLWPNNTANGRWRAAPTLVSDFRFVLRERVYPRRDIRVEDFLRGLKDDDILSLSDPQLRIAKAILQGNDNAAWKLARFQTEATIRVLHECARNNERSTGTIVCAGTGSGKTLAFYLPVLIHIQSDVGTGRYTRCMAIYPRNELLKDQFSETYRILRRVQERYGACERCITIGALFGGTPTSNRDQGEWLEQKGWDRTGDGHSCPFLVCPEQKCLGAMIWKDSDRQANKHVLVCSECGHLTHEDALVLTRDDMRRTPPDILFTTTEMLNQHLSDYSGGDGYPFNGLFGVGVPVGHRPSVVLLDEVHIYDGPHGAQVAYLLRRWQTLAKTAPHFVGLSATLLDAPRFFGELTGCPPDMVTEVVAMPQDLERQGMEYMLALKGDAVSGTQLLSTTIQTCMLMRRMLDSNGTNSGGLYGSRVFAFTDNLDVANRLFFNLLDAEGRDSWGRSTRVPLAAERESVANQHAERLLAGQSWDAAEEIGHDLQVGQRIERTTSQDTGVDANVDTVVATAALEVGYNDHAVGCVIQHKSPNSSAQFLQRKGRAGRDTAMRPWTLVVLSDFGRDRHVFHAYEELFDPELKPRFLPLGNVHILRMQATYALMDWVGLRLQSAHAGGNVWREWSGPKNQRERLTDNRLRRTEEILQGLLDDPEERNRFADFLRRSLGVKDARTLQLLWEPPRSLIRHVVPTLLRRLATDWSTLLRGARTDHVVRNNPLPEFVPSMLFSDLNVPELIIMSPAPQVNMDAREDPMDILQGLGEFAPGRVSHRFGVAHRYARHWIEPNLPTTDPEVSLELSTFCNAGDYMELGCFTYREGLHEHTLRCVRPLRVRTVQPPPSVGDTSNAFQRWRWQMRPLGDGWPVGVSPGSALAPVVEELTFYMHADHSPVEVRRFSTGAKCSVAGKDVAQGEREVTYQDNQAPVAIGCSFTADGMFVRAKMPSNIDERIAGSASCGRGMRSARFMAEVLKTKQISAEITIFQRESLASIFFTALICHAIEKGCALEKACEKVVAGKGCVSFGEIIEILYQSRQEETTPERQRELRDHLCDQGTLDALAKCAQSLWEPWCAANWEPWLRECFAVTLAAGLRGTVTEVCEDVDERDIVVDIEYSADSIGLWLTETAVGGVGIVDRTRRACCEDQPGFFSSWANQFLHGSAAFSSQQLSRLVALLPVGAVDTLQPYAAAIRGAGSVEGLEIAYKKLTATLRERGFRVDHGLMGSLSQRLLRPGTSAEIDELLSHTISQWDGWEERLGVEIEPSTVAFYWRQEQRVDKALGVNFPDQLARHCAITGMLWPRGRKVRNGELVLYSPFSSHPDPEKDIVACVLDMGVVSIPFSEEGDWRSLLTEQLRARSRAKLTFETTQVSSALDEAIEFVSQPVPYGYFMFYPRLVACERGVERVTIEFELMEVWGGAQGDTSDQ
jgi:hypothetical protein